MPTTITLDFFGDVQLKRTLADIDARALDLRPVWEYLTTEFTKAERLQFTTLGVYGSGRRWAPLSPAYARWKARNYPGKDILRRTDDLFNSLTRRPLGIEVLEPSYMVIGSDVYYGRYHQLGGGVGAIRGTSVASLGSRVRSFLPQRRPVEFPESQRVAWVRAIQRYIVTGELP